VSVAAAIAIDGPEASGKTAVGRAVAAKLGYLFLDTGAMYRALTYLALNEGTDLADESALTKLAQRSTIDVQPSQLADGRPYSVFANGSDITWQIRERSVALNVSQVSAWPLVRREMVASQRQIAARGRCVLAGRDIGTVVLPQADLKVYLTASVDVRAQRRLAELVAQGQQVSLEQVRRDMERRDRIDSQRATSPLTQAPDATLIDSTALTLEAVVERIVTLARGQCDAFKKG
jgi:cytidylate kinase